MFGVQQGVNALCHSLYAGLEVPHDHENAAAKLLNTVQFKPWCMRCERKPRLFPVYCLRQIRTRKRVRRGKKSARARLQHHGPLSNQLGPPGEPIAANTTYLRC
jgi:hypothetical protein